jgi:hypothetical protein
MARHTTVIFHTFMDACIHSWTSGAKGTNLFVARTKPYTPNPTPYTLYLIP